ncbi:DddA-like double-stranded DNA deaminase toxin [Actinosynnema pretiosum]|uniref:SCP1.201-like deaminase n=1 Tax=Actinosynnema pretiosum TaxID=42197 RepID=A0A290Z229_9PSEU|nr:DddA-like double-stranded DNA deaminase toxin [Actinosynnema pretiosum]ATE53019.1 hypothetical protein CNX65_06750 [Actinosynnema pretiosum]
MPSLGDVGAALGRVAEVAAGAQACLAQAADLAAEAAELVEAAGAGSGQTDVVTAAAAFREVAHDADRVVGRDLDAALGAVRRIVERLGTGGEHSPEPPPGLPEDDRVRRIKAGLPEPDRAASRVKTRGAWFAGTGPAQPVVSGEDADSAVVHSTLLERGYPLPGAPYVTTHVEMKLAVRMVGEDLRHATLVIDNVPCGLVLGCERLLGVVLPAGFSLTVHGAGGYERTFTGGQKPPW